MKACSLNYRDLLMKSGLSASGGGGDVVPLSDGAGIISALGEGVERLKVGDRVALTFFRDWEDGPFEMRYHTAARGGSCDGVLAESVLAPAHSVVKVPEYLTTAEAATLPCAALTAWHALMERSRPLEPGDTVLCLGTGGVSIFALQIAKAAGAKVLITSSSDEKLVRAEGLGADAGINYLKHVAWEKQVRELTDGRGVDRVIEVGGPGTIERSIDAVAVGGAISLIGVLTGFESPHLGLFPLVTHNADLSGIYVGSRAMFERMNSFLLQHKIRPVIDEEFVFQDSLKAYATMRDAGHFGKLVVTI
jgi:NADPH:quinone reductase-like Zn-dependent oxidoreductase